MADILGKKPMNAEMTIFKTEIEPYKLNDCIDNILMRVDRLETKFADTQPVDRWISVKDRLPEIGKSVLIYYPKWDGDEIQVAKLEDDGMMFDICGEFNIGTGVITHWMPLPEPPKGGDTE